MLDEREILNIVGQEMANSAGGNENDTIDYNRQAALAAYLGDSEPVPEGRSSVTSTDVADAIEWIMPEVMKAFTQNNEVVTFDACYEGDERQAELESKFTYDVLMKDNNGFIILHQFFKDALMQKNGFIKVFYEEEEIVSTEHFTGLTEPEYNMTLAGPGVEVVEESMEVIDNIPVFNIKVKITKSQKKLRICSVPPEQFRVNRMHNSVDLSTARFTAHVSYKTRSDLVIEGYDKDAVDALPTNDPVEDDMDYRFYLQGEITQPDGDISSDDSQRVIEIAECYMKMDLNEDGIAELVKVTVAGWDTPNKLLDIEEIDEIPFISTTAILMSHKLFGLSMYDRLIEIQKQKTQLWRNILDNMYLQNNQRHAIVEGQVNIDDLLISRPGGVVRIKRPDAIQPLPNPPLSADSYKMMDYLDQVRAGRAGVSPEGAVTDSMIGDRVGSEGIEKMMNQKEELVGLMIRVLAETGVKPLCYMIRNQLMKHQDVVLDYKFRGLWVQVDPRQWSKRSKTTVRVGTGSGNRQEQRNTLGMVMQAQQAIIQRPGQTLVTPQHEYNVYNDLVKLGGFPGAGQYFLDPESPQGQQNAQMIAQQQQQEMMEQKQQEYAMLQANLKLAEAELAKAEAALESVRLKGENELLKLRLEEEKAQAKAQVDWLKQQLDEAKALNDAVDSDKELDFKYWDRNKYYDLEEKKVNKADNSDG